MNNTVIKAILKINPTAEVSVSEEDINSIVWHNGTTPISKEDIEAQIPIVEQEIEDAAIKKTNDKITLQFTSRSFLQQQVRSMVGCLKYLGESKWDLKDFIKSFKSKNRIKCAPPAPACGLYLTNIEY